MSMLIKGMEKPENCNKCCFDFCGTCLINGEDVEEYERIYTKFGNREALIYKNPDCPLSEVPTPHGRLIDADKMEKEVCGGCKHGEHKYSNCIDCALANAPTVIEAEGE